MMEGTLAEMMAAVPKESSHEICGLEEEQVVCRSGVVGVMRKCLQVQSFFCIGFAFLLWFPKVLGAC